METDKETNAPYRPGFMQHFDQEDKQKKVGKKHPPVGPQSIFAYFPNIPDGMDFRDYVSF